MSSDENKPTHYKFDLDCQLETCVQEYEEERERYWQSRLQGVDWGVKGLFGHAEAVAGSLLGNAHDLVDHQSLPDKPIQFTQEQTEFLNQTRLLWESLEEQVPSELRQTLLQYFKDSALVRRPGDASPLLKLVWERLCVQLAWEVVGERVVTGANRILQLTELVVKGNPSPATLRFLRRVSRCFVWGFDAECVILCRGVIDTAFADAVTDAVCDKHRLEKARFGHTLANRIKAACLEGIIDEDTKKRAFRVNTPATKAAHNNPEEAVDVLEILKDTTAVIQRLVVSGSP